MREEYQKQIALMRAHDGSAEFRQANATLRALIAEDEVAATQSLVEATHLMVTASQTAANSADRQGRRLLLATWVLAGATIGLVIATVVLVVVTARHGG